MISDYLHYEGDVIKSLSLSFLVTQDLEKDVFSKTDTIEMVILSNV